MDLSKGYLNIYRIGCNQVFFRDNQVTLIQKSVKNTQQCMAFFPI